MKLLKLLSFQNLGIYGLLVSLLSLFHLAVNLIWINLNKLPFPWDQAGHTIIALKFADFFQGKSEYSFISISDYYPPLTHILASILMVIFGREPNLGPVLVTGFFITSIVFLYLYTKQIFKNNLIAFVATLFYSFLPFVDNVSRYFLLEIPLVAVTLIALYLLEKTQNFSVKKYVYLFAVTAGCALLIKWAAAVYLTIPVLIKFYQIYESRINVSNAIKNIFTTGIIVFLINFLWYFSNMEVILNSIKITATAEESDPQSTLSLNNFVFYFHHMFNFQLTWPGMLVFLFSIPAFLIKEKKKGLVLFLNILFIYLTFSLVGNKDLRYIMILAPLSSIIVAWGLVKFFSFEKFLAMLVSSILIGYYLVYFFSLGFGFPIDPITQNIRRTIFLPVIGGIDLVNLATDSSFLLAPKYSPTVWPNLTIAGEMAKHDPSRKIRILIIAEKPFFNQVNMELSRRQLNKDKIEFFAPYRTEVLREDEIDAYLNNYSVVLVADKDLGPQGGIRHIETMRQLKNYLESGKSPNATKINNYFLPDGDNLSVYRIEQWPHETIVEELSKHDPNNSIQILVLSSKPEINAENLELKKRQLDKQKIEFTSKLGDEFSQFNLILVSEKQKASWPGLDEAATKINTYYLPDGDKLLVYKPL